MLHIALWGNVHDVSSKWKGLTSSRRDSAPVIHLVDNTSRGGEFAPPGGRTALLSRVTELGNVTATDYLTAGATSPSCGHKI